MAQQTAVEQFWEQIAEILPFSVDSVTAIKLYDKLQEAKQIDMKQKKECWVDGNNTQRCNSTKETNDCFDNYYNETYGNNQNK